MNRIVLAIILAFLSAFTLPFNYYASLAFALLSYLLVFKIVYTVLAEKYYGVPLAEMEYAKQKIIEKTESYRVSVWLKVANTTRTVEDFLTAKDFVKATQDVMEELMRYSPTIVIKKTKSSLDYYIKISEEGKDIQQVFRNLLTKLRALNRAMFREGIELKVLEPSITSKIIGLEKIKRNRKVVGFLGVISLMLIIAPPLLILLALLTALVLAHRGGYDVKGNWWFCSTIDVGDISDRDFRAVAEKVLNSLMSLNNATIIISGSPEALKHVTKLERKVTLSYTLGTMFDWLMTTRKAVFESDRLERRKRRNEKIYSVLIFTDSEKIKVDLEGAGYAFTRLLSKTQLLDKIYGVKKTKLSKLFFKHRETVAFTLDLAPFSPLLGRRFLPSVGIPLGEDEYGQVVRLSPKELPNFHGIIVGGSGAGKSLFLRHLMLNLFLNNVLITIIDLHSEYEDFIRALGGVVYKTPKVVPDLSYVFRDKKALRLFVKTVSAAYGLYSRAEKTALIEVMKNSRSFSEAKRKLPKLLSELEPLFEVLEKGKLGIEQLLEKKVPFELSLLEIDEEIATVITMLTLYRIVRYYQRKGRVRSTVRHIVVIDEGHEILSVLEEADTVSLKKETTLTKLVKATRKWGLFFLIASQNIESFSKTLTQEVGYIIA
ncbi:MAG: hypothetical protein DRJ52_08100, partial [Thermoprotei archaeon]